MTTFEQEPPETPNPPHPGRWLAEHLRGLNWEIPTERASDREIPFTDDERR